MNSQKKGLLSRLPILAGTMLAGMMLVGCATMTTEDINALQTSAAQGDPAAMLKLGDAYRDGNGVPQNYQEAERWYRQAEATARSQATAR